jgi:transcriptional regulator with XRE-family HTH domain
MVHKRIKQLREELGLKQLELADKVGLTEAAISMYERNKRQPDYGILAKFAEIFDCTVDYLLGITNNRNEQIKPPDEYTAIVVHAKNSKVTPEQLRKLIDFLAEQKQD